MKGGGGGGGVERWREGRGRERKGEEGKRCMTGVEKMQVKGGDEG